jgi:hypothetical protein
LGVEEKGAMPQWEYLEVMWTGKGWQILGEAIDEDTLDHDVLLGYQTLARLGEAGWELVATGSAGGTTEQYIFKRPKQ